MNKLFLTILLGILLIGVASAEFGNSLDSGLMGQYEFTEGTGNTIVNSYSGAVANGTLFNANTSIWTTGIFGSGLDFYEGTTNKGINVSNNSLTTNQSITICMYVKIRYANVSYLYSDWNNAPTGLNLYLSTNDSGNLLIQSAGGNLVTSPNSIADNTWKHICLNRNFLLNNLSMWIDGKIVGSVLTTSNATSSPGPQYIFNQGDLASSVQPIGYLDHVGFWNRSLNSTEIYTHSNQSFPNLTLINPVNNTLLTSNSFIVNLSLRGFNLGYSWKNITYSIWFNNGTLFNKTTFTELSGNNTQVNKSFNSFIVSDYIWNAEGCYNSSCYTGLNNYTFYNTSVLNAINYNSVVYETDYENILYNITVTNGLTPTSAKLFYNGTEYSMTITNTGGTNYTLSKLLSITSSMVGSNTFYITYNLSSTYKETSSTYNQLVNPILFGWCNTTLTTSYFNISFKDESTAEIINATIPTSTFYYWLGDSTLNKSFTYSNTTLNYNYPFCFIPQNKTLYLKPLIQYNNPSYEQRTYEPSTLTLTNATTNTTLYLLSTTDGIYVTFQVTNQADQVLSGVSVSGTRLIGSTLTTVASGITDSSGGVTFWLNYHYSHTFTFIKDGYETYTVTLTPTQTSYTISLSSTSTITTEDYTKGIKTYIYPKGREMYNNTIYNVIFNMTSSYYTLDSFGFRLRLSNGTIVGSASSTVEGTGASYLFNSSNYTSVYMDYYWVIDGNYTNSSTRWIITNSLYTDWSIKTFFDDLEAYLDSGIFGLDEFGRYLIAFLILFLIVGFMGYKFGMVNPIFISVLTFSVVFFLDVITGLIPDVRGIEHLVTYVAGLIAFLVIVGEGSR